MIDKKIIRENWQMIIDNLRKRNKSEDYIKKIEQIPTLEKNLYEIELNLNKKNAQHNSLSSDYQTAASRQDSKNLKEDIRNIEEERKRVSKKLMELKSTLPNILDDSVPHGTTAAENVEIKRWGNIEELKKNNVTLHYDFLDKFLMEQSVNMSSSRFAILPTKLAVLYRALYSFFLDHLNQSGFLETTFPFFLNEEALFNSGHVPAFNENIFWLESDEKKEKRFGLIPTAEAPFCNLFAQRKAKRVFRKEDLPIKMCSFTPCWRKEAGAAGLDTKGLVRLHQFGKVEMFMLSTPEDSKKNLDFIMNKACEILELLELPYRVVSLCGGDIGFSSAFTYDIEVFSPYKNSINFNDGFCEISSCSNCTDFQSRRSMVVYSENGEKNYVHMINGSGLPVERTLVSILEIHQKNNIVKIPTVLHKYTGFTEIKHEELFVFSNFFEKKK